MPWKQPLDKTKSIYCSYGTIPIRKKASPYLRSLGYSLKALQH